MALCTNCVARAYYTGTGDTSAYTFPFDYADPSEIRVAFYNESTREYEDISEWTLANRGTVSIDPPPTVDFMVYRCTDVSEPVAEFLPGDTIRAEDLNTNFNQALNAIDEVRCSMANDVFGEKGEKGQKGQQGIQGQKGQGGQDGLDGSDGISDIPGPKGAKGDKGDLGAQGPTGEIPTYINPLVTGWTIDSVSDADTSHVVEVPGSTQPGNLMVAVLMSRTGGGGLVAPAGWDFKGSYLDQVSFSGQNQTLSVYTRYATDSEPTSYTWTQPTSSRICGLMVSTTGTFDSVNQRYGQAQNASISTISNALNLTVATWIYSATGAATETYNQTANVPLVEITDSPKSNARISGGYSFEAGIINSYHVSANADNEPNHGIIDIIIRGVPFSGAGGDGAKGEKGQKGDLGPQGIKGEIGPQGVEGQQGAQGPQGIQGPAGAGITFKGQVDFIPSGSGDVTTVGGVTFTPVQGDAVIYIGTDAVVYTDDDSLLVFDGSDWVDGGSIQGPQGIQGEQGVAGPQGAKGNPGAPGTKGEQGIKGDTGAKGSDSTVQGPKGSEGQPGAKGEQGIKGEQGAKGESGVNTGGDVSSVNGQKGDVILGIQDMDDFEYNLAGITRTAATQIFGGSFNPPSNPDQYNLHTTLDTFYVSSTLNGIDESANLDALTGQTITVSIGAVSITGTVSFTTDKNGGASKGIHNLTSSIAPLRAADPSLPLVISYDGWSTTTIPLANGDIIQWDGQSFVPTQLEGLKGSTGGDVSSVNGQKGDVSLGIDDMNDFASTSTVGANWNNKTVDETTVNKFGEWFPKNSTTTRFFRFDRSNRDWYAAWNSLTPTDTFTVSYTNASGNKVTVTASAPNGVSIVDDVIDVELGQLSSDLLNDYQDDTAIIFTGGPFGVTQSLTDGDVITWNAATQLFEPAPLGQGGSGGDGGNGQVSLALEDLTNVNQNTSGVYTKLTTYETSYNTIRDDPTGSKFFIERNVNYRLFLVLGQVTKGVDFANFDIGSNFRIQSSDTPGTTVDLVVTDDLNLNGAFGYYAEFLTTPTTQNESDLDLIISQCETGSGLEFFCDDIVGTISGDSVPWVDGDFIRYDSAIQQFRPYQLLDGVDGQKGEQGNPGTKGDPGPSAVSTDPGNIATIGSDNLIFVPNPEDIVDVPDVVSWTIASLTDNTTAQEFAAPTSLPGNTLVAVIMSRSAGGGITAPAGWTLYGSYLENMTFPDNVCTLSVYTKTATESEPASYTWTQPNSARLTGFIVAVEESTIDTVSSNYGNAQTATISTVANKLNITAATWIFSATSSPESYSQTGDGITEITNSPLTAARISGGYTKVATTVTSTHSSSSTDYDPNHGMICIVMSGVEEEIVGEKGQKGEKGEQGISVKGEPGVKGESGTSVKGEPGDKGSTGSDGGDGLPGQKGEPGPTAVSADADNYATLGSDSLIYVPQPPPSSASLELEWLFVDGAVGPAPNYWQVDNNINPSAVTEIYLSTTVYPNRQIQNILELIDAGMRIYVQQRDAEANYLNLDVTGPAVNNGTYFTIPVSVYDSGSPFDVGTFCSFLIFQLGGGEGGGGGGSSDQEILDQALAFANGAGLAVEQGLLAAAGQPAKTVLAVAATNTGKVQGCSLGDGNVIEVFASGADFNANNVLYREFMSLGEPICFTGLSPGAIITSTQGFYGMGEQSQSGYFSPMGLMSLGLAFKSTFVYCFRGSQNAPGVGVNTGQIIICNGALPSTVTFTRNGSIVNGQEPKTLEPFELCYFYSNANGEYLIEATNPVMGAVQAYMGTNPQLEPGDPLDSGARFYDARLIMPLTNDGITWPRSGFVSAPYDNTLSKYYVRDGVSGDFPAVSPGAPVDFDAGTSTGANDSDYEPRGCTRLRVSGLVSAYSGADTAGLEATPMIPVSAMSQIVAQPFWVNDVGDGGNSGVAIGSPYEGTAKVYAWNTTSGVAELAYTVPLGRGTTGQGITPVVPSDQYYPCAGMVANEPDLDADPGVVQLEGALAPGYVIADVPITVVAQNGSRTLVPEIRSQNGTTTTSIITDSDETLMLGWTPPLIKAEVTTDTNGFTRKRVVSFDGTTTYVLT